MIILEGRSGKSRILDDLINNRLMNDKVIIMDAVGIPYISNRDGVAHYSFKGYPLDILLDDFGKGMYTSCEWIIMYLNIPEKDFDLEIFKSFDRKMTQNLLVTVQTDGEIKMKFA